MGARHEKIQEEARQRAERQRAREEAFEAREAGRGGAMPDFVIIGAQKGGTTSLYGLLMRHPLARRGARKEVHFFDDNFARGAGWYRSRFPAPRIVGDRQTITGEATPHYLFHRETPERMAETVPDAKLVALLRDPTERAYSHWRHERRLGFEDLAFEEAIAAEPERTRDTFGLRHFSYLARGRYAQQLARYRWRFPKDRMLVLKSEDLFADPRGALAVVQRFVGLPAWEPDAEALGPRNVGPASLGEMDPATRRRLQEHFAPHNEALYAMLGRDLDW